MDWLRQQLQRIGWPVDTLTDEEIAVELYCRWFDLAPEDITSQEAVTPAAAKGIFVSMAGEGNLDALCWSQGAPAPALDEIIVDQASVFRRDAEYLEAAEEFAGPDRRDSLREPASDFVDFVDPCSSEGSCGWLVDISARGAAFIVETADTPPIGSPLVLTIRKRNGDPTQTGPAIIVRTELLSDSLTLICTQLEGPWEPVG